MTSKERVLKTIDHKEPDRVPIGEWGIDHDHVSRIIGHHTYWRNRKDTTLALWEGRRDEVVESMKNDLVELVEKLDYDVIVVEMVPPKGYKPLDPPRKTGDGIWEDTKGNVYKYAASNDSIVCLTHPEPKEALTEEDISYCSNIVLDDSYKREFIDVVNLPNSGQIANLPMGSIVETLGVVNSLGFTPLTAGELPEPILNLVLPHARNQDMIVQAGLTGNLDMAFYALYNDPLCKHLTIPEIKEMGMRLLEAHHQYLPIFF